MPVSGPSLGRSRPIGSGSAVMMAKTRSAAASACCRRLFTWLSLRPASPTTPSSANWAISLRKSSDWSSTKYAATMTAAISPTVPSTSSTGGTIESIRLIRNCSLSSLR